MITRKAHTLRACITLYVLVSFIVSCCAPYAQAENSLMGLPPVTQFVNPSYSYSFPVLKGIKFDPHQPLTIEFIIDTADKAKITQKEAAPLIKYFLAALTIPEEDIWVNLSPYEQDKIVPSHLGITDLGKDLLSQDYILKQLLASLTYPESDTGKHFWQKTYDEVARIAGTTKVPINTFNKIWIVPKSAEVYENKTVALITEATLEAMLEEDYLLMAENAKDIQKEAAGVSDATIKRINETTSRMMREHILPKVNEDVNSGKNFATLRQIYHSLILGIWFKKKFKDSLYRYYIDKGKIAGIDVNDKDAKDKIYNHYVKAFEKGLYNYVKKDVDPATRKNIKRRYYSGGFSLARPGYVPPEADPLTAASSSMAVAAPSDQWLSLQPLAATDLTWLFYTFSGNAKEVTVKLRDANTMAVIDTSQTASSAIASAPTIPEYLIQKLRLFKFDQMHVNSLLKKFAAEKIPLIIGNNFIPSAFLTEEERKHDLGIEDYDDIALDSANAEAAKDVAVTFNPMDGGLGTAVVRFEYLGKVMGRKVDPKAGRPKLGAKATDLAFEIGEKKEKISIAEIKLLRAIYDAAQYGGAVFLPLVNDESAPSYIQLFDSICFEDRIDESKPEKRTYRELMREKGLSLLPYKKERQMLYQGNLPIIDLETNQVTDKFTAPGGHGQWGVRLLYEATYFKQPEDGKTYISAFYNGDGVSNFPDSVILGWMARNNIPVVMIATTKAPIDKKGGQLGKQVLEDGTERKQILELAQAKKISGKHVELFYDVGLQEGERTIEGIKDGKPHTYNNEPGEQAFNTNTALINNTILSSIFQEVALLEEVEFEGELLSGKELIERIITPDLIENVKEKDDGKKYTQLEGAMASALLNLDAFFAQTKDERIKEILRRHNVDQILRIINISAEKRSQFFTPVKNAFDFWFQAYSDYYTLDRNRWMLVSNKEDQLPPLVNLVSWEKNEDGSIVTDDEGNFQDDKFWADVMNNINSFGHASVMGHAKGGLKSLTIEGRVALADAILGGTVEIKSDYRYPHIFNLNTTEVKERLGQDKDGRLILEDVSIKIDREGAIEIGRPSEIAEGPSTGSKQKQALKTVAGVSGDLAKHMEEGIMRFSQMLPDVLLTADNIDAIAWQVFLLNLVTVPVEEMAKKTPELGQVREDVEMIVQANNFINFDDYYPTIRIAERVIEFQNQFIGAWNAKKQTDASSAIAKRVFDGLMDNGFDALLFGGSELTKLFIFEPLIQKVKPEGFVLMGSLFSKVYDKEKLSEFKITYPQVDIMAASDLSDENKKTEDIGYKTLAAYRKAVQSLKPGQTVLVVGTMGSTSRYSAGGTSTLWRDLYKAAQKGVSVIVVGERASAMFTSIEVSHPNIRRFPEGTFALKQAAPAPKASSAMTHLSNYPPDMRFQGEPFIFVELGLLLHGLNAVYSDRDDLNKPEIEPLGGNRFNINTHPFETIGGLIEAIKTDAFLQQQYGEVIRGYFGEDSGNSSSAIYGDISRSAFDFDVLTGLKRLFRGLGAVFSDPDLESPRVEPGQGDSFNIRAPLFATAGDLIEAIKIDQFLQEHYGEVVSRHFGEDSGNASSAMGKIQNIPKFSFDGYFTVMAPSMDMELALAEAKESFRDAHRGILADAKDTLQRVLAKITKDSQLISVESVSTLTRILERAHAVVGDFRTFDAFFTDSEDISTFSHPVLLLNRELVNEAANTSEGRKELISALKQIPAMRKIIGPKKDSAAASSALAQDESIDRVGGIAMEGIDIYTDPASIPVDMFPFGIKNFSGFTFQIISINDIDDLNTAISIEEDTGDDAYKEYSFAD